MKNRLFPFFILLFALPALAQPSSKGGATDFSFVGFQKTLARPGDAFKRLEDTLQKQFQTKNLKWPAKYIYLRSFKYDSQLEIWVKDEIKDPFQLFKTYKVCALAGSLGPKRMEGDYQVPEGFYYINEFNPKSSFHLSLGINYPNSSDRILSDSSRPGSAIYIHGSCVTVGCIPITDPQIEEVYILAAFARDHGQDFIPVHIFPVRFNVQKSVNFLENMTKDDPTLKRFASRMEDAFDYFEKFKQLPVVMISTKGEYMIDAVPVRVKVKEKEKVVRIPVQHRIRTIDKLVEAVHQWPQYPGGGDAFMKYLEQLGKDVAEFLPKGVKKAYVQVEFIIDKDGIPTNFKVLKGTNDPDLSDEIITRMEKMPAWQPALLFDKAVPKKMIQTVTIGVF